MEYDTVPAVGVVGDVVVAVVAVVVEEEAGNVSEREFGASPERVSEGNTTDDGDGDGDGDTDAATGGLTTLSSRHRRNDERKSLSYWKKRNS